MPTALWIAHVKVTDPDSYAKYAELATVAIAAHDGVFHVAVRQVLSPAGQESAAHARQS